MPGPAGGQAGAGRGGWHGAYLRIDVTHGRSQRVPLRDDVLERFVGGVGLGTWLCLQEGGAECDPLAPEAPLVFCLSPLVGTPFATSAKLAVVARSPLTGFLCDALTSSHFAVEAKRTGYDAFVLVGRAPRLSRLSIDDGTVSLESAEALRGHPAAASERAGFRTAAIGAAGEAGVLFAAISNDGRHAGRGGLGAVMGAKRLKALSVRGSRETALAHPDEVRASGRVLARRSLGPETAKYRELGTVANVALFDRLGALPTRNFQSGSLGGDALHAETLRATHRTERASCAQCAIGCEHRFAARGAADSVRLEYETVFALGAGLGIRDADAVVELAARCDHLGLDTLSAGGTLATAMEAGLGGLRFGEAGAALRALDDIAARRGLGALLADGSRRTAERLGRPELAMHVKGLELPGYHPARLPAMALGLAVCHRGADHNRSSAYELDFADGPSGGPLAPARIAQVVAIEDRAAALDSLVLCKFVRHVFSDFEVEGAELLRQVTGVEVDLRALGARVAGLRRLFNLRAGWRRADDGLPARLLTGGLEPAALAALIEAYYRERGWSADGRLPRATRMRLDLLDLAVPVSPPTSPDPRWRREHIPEEMAARASGAPTPPADGDVLA